MEKRLERLLLLCFYCILPCMVYFVFSIASAVQWFSFFEAQLTVIKNYNFCRHSIYREAINSELCHQQLTMYTLTMFPR